MSISTEKAIEYIQKDLQQMKQEFDKILRPFLGRVRSLENENAALRGDISQRMVEQDRLMRLINRKAPGLVEEAIAVLVDPKKRGYKKFRQGWVERLQRDSKVRRGES